MMVRTTTVAGPGWFYESDPGRCRAEIESCVPDPGEVVCATERPLGGVVPHAGWKYSGRVAGHVFAAVAARRQPQTIVIFGAVHRPIAHPAAIYPGGAWETPLGRVEIDARFAERLLDRTGLIADDPFAHEREHSIEVQVPFVRHLFPHTRLVPIMVLPSRDAPEVGRAVARVIADYHMDAVAFASTDLTHYGPQYRFTPKGIGDEGLQWAKDVNDRRMIDLILGLDADQVVSEAKEHHNACGSGAVAATLAACKQLGAARAELLIHTTSSEILAEQFGQSSTDAVGYAGVILG